MNEFEPMITEVFANLGEAPPNQMDVYYIMKTFDRNNDGKLDTGEYVKMIKALAGDEY